MQTTQFLIFVLDDRPYGVPLAQVSRVVRAVDCTPLPNAPEIVGGVIDHRGEVVPVFNVRRRLGFAAREVAVTDQFVLATAGEKRVAMMVDWVKGVLDWPVEKIVGAEEIFPTLEKVAGAMQTADGLTLIHDLGKFLSLEEQSQLEQALTGEAIHG